MTDGLRIDQWKGLKATTVANFQGNKNTKKEPSIVLWMFSDHAFWEWIIKAQITWIHKSFWLEMFLMLSRSLRSWGFYWILLLSLGGALFAIMQLFTTENEILNKWESFFCELIDRKELWRYFRLVSSLKMSSSKCRGFMCISESEDVDCDDDEAPKNITKKAAKFLSTQAIIDRTRNCHTYFLNFPQIGHKYDSLMEKEFPIAFAISLHKDVGILETFLMMSFRQTDSYCFHIDAKADGNMLQ